MEANLFLPNETYVPVKWDLSDVVRKCRDLERAAALAAAATPIQIRNTRTNYRRGTAPGTVPPLGTGAAKHKPIRNPSSPNVSLSQLAPDAPAPQIEPFGQPTQVRVLVSELQLQAQPRLGLTRMSSSAAAIFGTENRIGIATNRKNRHTFCFIFFSPQL